MQGKDNADRDGLEMEDMSKDPSKTYNAKGKEIPDLMPVSNTMAFSSANSKQVLI